MIWLRKLHLYCGLTIALFLFIFAVTGGALLFKDEIWRLEYPEFGASPPILTPDEHAAAFRAVEAAFPGDVQFVKTPRTGQPTYHVYLDDGEAFVDPLDHRIIDRWAWYESPVGILTELHVHLAAGQAGKLVAGIVALTTTAMAVSGLVLWWPTRRAFRAASLWPASLRRVHLLKLHRDLGAIASPMIVLFTLTAGGIVFYPTTRGILNGLFSSTTMPPPPTEVLSAPTLPASAAIVRAAQHALPEAKLMSYYPPRPGKVAFFRFREPGEIHPNGRSVVYVDSENQAILQTMPVSEQPLGERISQYLYPLHAAKMGHAWYTLIAFIAALSLATIGMVGPASYLVGWRKRARDREQRRPD
ncbi:MAG: PepSY-associated TM helix domain-containing protein [Woeseiaceae bacterium]